ncbi:hypothetical protein [Spongiivirga citrea]|uniref:hypothetical protein n=1 Tax=Spongiivirga citrea TaxID=1481457 RepID=UPI0013DAFDC9|nr:hypothetical protein [Spongiivirga citrea]
MIKQKKNTLDVDQRVEANEIEQLANKLPKKQHAFLTINTKQVLTKTIPKSGTISALLNEAFPNIAIDHFYYSFCEGATTTFISICRKEIVNDLVSSYQKEGIKVVQILLGPIGIKELTPFISGNLISNGFKTTIEDNDIKNIEKSESSEDFNYHINGLDISSQSLLAFSGALQSVLRKENANSNLVDRNNQVKTDYLQDRFFFVFSRVAIALLLGSLLINFFLFSYYFDGVNTLQQQAQTNTTNSGKLLELNEKVKRKQQLSENLLNAASSKSSKQIDEIITILPAAVVLEEINYQPLLRAIKNDSAINVKANEIFISGTTANKESFTAWVAMLESLNWIKSVLTSSYEEGNRTANFELILTINDEKK